MVRVWLCGGNKEGTRQELLAATHCIRPSNGWNLTTTTNVTVSLLTMRGRYTRNRFLSSRLGCVTSCYKCEYLPKSDISVACVPLVSRPTLCSRCSTVSLINITNSSVRLANTYYLLWFRTRPTCAVLVPDIKLRIQYTINVLCVVHDA